MGTKPPPLETINKTVIVTGASGNMGQAVVRKFIAEGYKVIGTVTPDDPVIINFPAVSFEKVIVDLMNEEDAERFTQSVIEKYKNINVAVFTVGGFAIGSIADTKTSDIVKQYKLNFETTYNACRPIFLQMMQQGYGRIFLTGARPGIQAGNAKGMVAYGLAKSLIFRLAELMNDEAKGKNVVVSVLVPSTIDTPQNRKSMPAADFNSWVKPEAIADAIYFYCTETAEVIREPVIKLYGNS